MSKGYYTRMSLPHIGVIWAARTKRGLSNMSFGGKEAAFVKALSRDVVWKKDPGQFKVLKQRLCDYAHGRCVDLNLPLDIHGTPFQRRIWLKMLNIPYGKTVSYTELARFAGRPNAQRAAANACGANPVPIIIPCHRITASNGKLGGFSSGIKIKKLLHQIEGIQF